MKTLRHFNFHKTLGLYLLGSIFMPAHFAAAQFIPDYMVMGNDTLPYQILIPDDINPGEKLPIIVFLHGMGERGRDNMAQLAYVDEVFTPHNEKGTLRAIVVLPQCNEQEYWPNVEYEYTNGTVSNVKWYDGISKPLQRVRQLALQLEAQYPIDPARRYIAGLSMGGFGATEALALQGDYWAAGFSICAGTRPEYFEKLIDKPLWLFHGDADPVVPVQMSRELSKYLLLAKPVVRYTEYADVGHDSWNKALREPELLPWLLKQQLK